MNYALVLENDAASCNKTSAILASLGYLVTPTFNLRKALHAVQMIQFDLIVTWTVVNPDDRRALPGEFRRHSPDAILVLVKDPGTTSLSANNIVGVNAILYRPFTADDVKRVVESSVQGIKLPTSSVFQQGERRKRIAC